MDKRVLRTRKGKSRSTRPYDRPSQGILGRVASKVKNLLNPSWLFNVSQWIGAPEEEEPGCSTDLIEEESHGDDDFISQPPRANKRPRLQLHEPSPSILSAGTQTWLETPPSHNLYNTLSRIPPTAAQSSLVENKESSVALNGDDHSENSEGSASTSGCSSLVSGNKDRSSRLPSASIRLSASALHNLQGELKDSIGLKNRRDVASQKGGFSGDISSRSLWSSNLNTSGRVLSRPPSVAHSSQPSFNLSTFGGPSKMNQSLEKRVPSPFYEGKTRFGGASARRMPVTVAPYQVDKSFSQTVKVKNKVNIRENCSENSLEGMSSAAKRILMTLEKMSSPVMDAKKIPNTSTSPVDLSLYLTPPKHRRNSVFTPPVPAKGPPIANISAITKLTALKSYSGVRMNRTIDNSYMETSDKLIEPKNSFIGTSSEQAYNLVATAQHIPLKESEPKSGGGKIKTKLNQLHHSTKEPELPVALQLPNIPLPISKLPTINFGSKPEKKIEENQNSKTFTFSSPIEYVPPVAAALSTSTPVSEAFDKHNKSGGGFAFSDPIEHELPSSTQLKENSIVTNTSVSASKVPTMWECSECWVRNPVNESKCVACEALRPCKKNSSDVQPATNIQFSSPLQTSSSFKFGSFSSTSSAAVPTFKFEMPSSNSTTVSSGFKLSGITSSNNTNSPQGAFFGGVKLEGCKSSPAVLSNAKPCDKIEGTGDTDKSEVMIIHETITNKSREFFNNKEGVNELVNTSKSSNIVVPQPGNHVTFHSNQEDKTSVLQVKSSPLTAQKQNKISDSFISDKEKTSDSSFKQSNINVTAVPSSASSAFKILFSGNKHGEWECDTCYVRNPADKLKCIACETLHSVKEKNSGAKNPENFKLGYPQHSSPITFKLGSSAFTPQTTVNSNTSTVAKFDTSETTSASTFFNSSENVKTPALNAVSNETSGTGTFKITDVGFKFDSPKQPSGLNLNSEKNCESNEKQGKSFGTISETSGNKINGSLSADKSEVSDSLVASTNITNTTDLHSSVQSSMAVSSDQNVTVSSNALATTVNTKPSTATEAKSTLFVSASQNNVIVSETSQESKKVSQGFTFGSSADAKTESMFTFKAAPAPSFSVLPTPVSTKEETTKLPDAIGVEKSVPNSMPKVGIPKVENHFKMPMFPFQMPTQTSTPNLSDKMAASKTAIESSTTVSTNILSSAVSTTVPSFNNNSTSSTFSLISDSKPSESAPVNLSNQFQPAVTKSQDVKTTVLPFTSSTTSSFAFGCTNSLSSTSGPTNFSFFPSTSTTVAPSGNAGIFTFGSATNATNQQHKPGGFTFKGLSEEKPTSLTSNPATFNTPATSSTSSVFKFGASVPASSGGFVFGAAKSEAQSTAPSNFVFGSGTASNPNPSAFSGFQIPQAVNHTFQFGGHSSGNPATTPAFGTPSGNFGFGNKSENTNQCAVSQAPIPTFGCPSMQPVFGNQPAPVFVRPDRPTSGGFNFGVAASNAPVFRFGSEEKKQTTSGGGFSFGTPSQAETANTFQTGFNMNTPPSFNFGATSTPSGPFQFAASTSEGGTAQASAPRKIRKAVRRVTRKQD